jgi:peptide/nickel transport system permease protein
MQTANVHEQLKQWKSHYLIRHLIGGINGLREDRLTFAAAIYLFCLLCIGLIGPWIAPYPYDETLYAADGAILRAMPPSLAHPLGTTGVGYDVLSRLLYGARPTVIAGFLGGLIIVTIGLTIGLIAGYVGGIVENILMRFTDFMYSIPLLPFALVLVAFIGTSFLSSVVVIGSVLWRSSARVLRAQVLQIKQRPYIIAARGSGASAPRIIITHILPNVASMAMLYFAMGAGFSIIVMASLSFIGAANPFVPSWGVMVRNAYKSGMMARALWWSLTPGILISVSVLSMYLVGRGFESTDNQSEIAIEG